jgi:hypothetical protein
MRDEPEREAASLIRRTVAGLGWLLLFALIGLASVAVPALVVWAFVDLEAARTVLLYTIGLGSLAGVVWMLWGADWADFSGDW